LLRQNDWHLANLLTSDKLGRAGVYNKRTGASMRRETHLNSLQFRQCWHLIYLSALMLLACSSSASAEKVYDLRYTVELQPQRDAAKVTIAIDDASLLRTLDFNIKPRLHRDIQANGELVLEDGRALWTPPKTDARLTLWAKISHEREDDEYDALMTPEWAIFRGDDLVPTARVRTAPGAKSRASLRFILPKSWTSVETGWPNADDDTFVIRNPERRFDRPTGWMIAGKLGIRRDQLGETDVVVAAPKGSDLHRMDVLTFVNFVWPEIEGAFQSTPPKLLIAGAGEPMWRGGLSAPTSLFLHADRPLVSENGTSTLVHELVHMVTGIHGADNHDWIAEGLTEFYAVELVYRAGGMTSRRREKVFRDLAEWGDEVKSLLQRRSTGPVTARAAVLFNQLDQEIRQRSNNAHSIDDVARKLMSKDTVSLDDLREATRTMLGSEPKALKTPLLGHD
jgi:hypothetical protein